MSNVCIVLLYFLVIPNVYRIYHLIAVVILAISLRNRVSRWSGLLQGIALQMAVAAPIAILQLTGFVWKSWSIDTAEAIKVFSLSVLFDMAGWTVIAPFEWLVPKRQT